jgi:DMSO/TMAO reductase YedYZ molybdopterin-dependent catalytic subunit
METGTPEAPDAAVPPEIPGLGSPVGRRVVLGMVGLGVAGVAAGSWISAGLTTAVNSTVPEVNGILPGAGGFRIYTVISGYPDYNPDTYRLTLDGLVDKPMTLSLSDLAGMKQTGLTKDFQCVTGWRVDNVPWSGVLLSDLLNEAGVQSGAGAVNFTSFDGAYTESLTLEQAMRPDMLVATSLMGQPLTQEHGAPVRLYVAPMYGYKSIKWLNGISVAKTVKPGYWEVLGYDVDAWVGQSNGRSDAPIA